MAGLFGRLPVEVGERHEPLGLPTDDGQRQGQAQGTRADHGLGCAAHRHPYGQWVLDRPRPHPGVVQGRAQPSGPGHVAVVGAYGQEQLEFLGEQLVVVVEVVAEERK